MSGSKKDKPEVRIKGVSENTHQQICNISDHLGVTISQFLRPKLREIIDSYPEHMRTPPKEY